MNLKDLAKALLSADRAERIVSEIRGAVQQHHFAIGEAYEKNGYKQDHPLVHKVNEDFIIRVKAALNTP